jgi:hypothetical protein
VEVEEEEEMSVRVIIKAEERASRSSPFPYSPFFPVL